MNRPLLRLFLLGLSPVSLVLLPCTLSGGVVPAPRDSSLVNPGLTVIGNLSINNDGAPLGSRTYFATFNLANQDLVVQKASEAAALSTLADVTDMIRSGFGPGHDWTGTGITSSAAALDKAQGYGITAVGVLLNDDGSHVNPDGSGQPLYTVWDGFSVNQFSVLVKYTFLGDTNLSGSVDSADLNTVTSNLGTGLGWGQGEFNYTGGVVTSLDVQQTNLSLARESRYPLVVPVPEPSSFALVVCCLIGLASFSLRIVQAPIR